MSDPKTAADLAAFTDLINRYSLAMDSREWGLMDDVFTRDAVISMNGTPFSGRTIGVGAIRIFIECCALTHHMNSNVVIRRREHERVFVTSNFRAWHRGVDDHSEETFETMGTYEDEFIRTESGWRICRRDESSPIVMGDYSFFEAAVPRIEALLAGSC